MNAHIKSLQRKHDELDTKIHDEANYAARNDMLIKRYKEEKVHLRDEIERLSKTVH